MPAITVKITKEYIQSIRTYMIEEMLTTKELAHRADISEGTIYKLFKNGKTGLNTIKKLKLIGIEPLVDIESPLE